MFCFCERYVDPRDLHVLTHACPTRRSSNLECPPHILDHADHVGSTSSILDYALRSPDQTLIVATEPHISHQMEKTAPHKTFIGAPGADGNCNCNMCPYMALNTMEKPYISLRDPTPRIAMAADNRKSTG